MTTAQKDCGSCSRSSWRAGRIWQMPPQDIPCAPLQGAPDKAWDGREKKDQIETTRKGVVRSIDDIFLELLRFRSSSEGHPSGCAISFPLIFTAPQEPLILVLDPMVLLFAKIANMIRFLSRCNCAISPLRTRSMRLFRRCCWFFCAHVHESGGAPNHWVPYPLTIYCMTWGSAIFGQTHVHGLMSCPSLQSQLQYPHLMSDKWSQRLWPLLIVSRLASHQNDEVSAEFSHDKRVSARKRPS